MKRAAVMMMMTMMQMPMMGMCIRFAAPCSVGTPLCLSGLQAA